VLNMVWPQLLQLPVLTKQIGKLMIIVMMKWNKRKMIAMTMKNKLAMRKMRMLLSMQKNLEKCFYSLCSNIKNLRADDENQSWDHRYKETIAQAVSDSRSKTSSSGSTIHSKCSALDKIFQSIPKADDADDEVSAECDKW
jgi:hypothetical protein